MAFMDKVTTLAGKAVDKGNKFVICSGRIPGHIKYILKDLGFYGNKNEYVIC